MKILYNSNNIIVSDLVNFNLDLILDCGQAFRWMRCEDGSWHGVVRGLPLTVRQDGGTLTLFDTSPDDFERVWRGYFDLDRDYSELCERFSADASMQTAIGEYPGIRVLNQEPWETLCSFIISQNNNIPRIKGIIARLCEGFGNPLPGGNYSFPNAQRLSGLTVDDLSPLRAGFRAKYILDAARKVADGEVNLTALCDMNIDDARVELIKIKGVGAKVAECTLLYGCGFAEAFPVDVWIKRVLAEIYPDGLPACILGEQGIAQQYLFHWRRNAIQGD